MPTPFGGRFSHRFSRHVALGAAFASLSLAGFLVFACGDATSPDEPTPDASEHDDTSATADGDEPSPDGSSGDRDAVAHDDADAPPTKPRHLSPTFQAFDVNHVLSTGQSLAVGIAGTPPLSLTQPFDNKMFASGVVAEEEDGGLDHFVPLVEGDWVDNAGTLYSVETMSSALANAISQMARDEFFADRPPAERGHDVLVSNHGISGKQYSVLKKGTAAYALGMAQVGAAFDLAKAAGKSYVVRAVTTVHGEADHFLNNTHYAQDLAEWQSDYEKDVRAKTGQTEGVPMFETQMSSWPVMGQATSPIPEAQLQAHVASVGKIVLVGPKYHLPYAPDGIHLTNAGYRHMGEDYAKVYRRVIFEGKVWEPVRPREISRDGATIRVKFFVPEPPLVLDTKLVSDPGDRGFQFVDGTGSPPRIVAVTVAAPDTVEIELSAAPKGPGGHLRYAYRVDATPVPAGPTTGPRGNLRDSDATVSRNGDPLYNWSVHFDEVVP